MKTTISVEVEKETYDVGVALGAMISALKAKKSIKEIIDEELSVLAKAVDGIGQIPGEYLEDKGAFFNAISIPVVAAIIAPPPVLPTP